MGNYGFSSPQGTTFGVILLVFVALAVITSILRVISRRMRHLDLAWDDACAVAATVIIFGCSIYGVTTVTRNGLGMHADHVTPLDIQEIAKSLVVYEVLYAISLALLKTSMMLLYHKLFGAKDIVRYSVYVTAAVVWAWSISIILAAFLTCRPLAYNWDTSIPGGKCGNRNLSFMITGAFNMVTDVMVIAIPVPHIWGLHLAIGRRIGLIAAFAIGLFVSAISMVRVASLQKIIFDDLSFTLPVPMIWTFLEMDLAIIACNLPLLRPVATFFLPSTWMGSSKDKSNSRPYGTSNAISNDRSRRPNNSTYSQTFVDGVQTKNRISMNQRTMFSNRWSDEEADGHSEIELTRHAAPVDGIQVKTDFRVESNV